MHPTQLWAIAKHQEKRSCIALDKLMDMIGLKSVKKDALDLYQSICTYVQYLAHTTVYIKAHHQVTSITHNAIIICILY